MYVRCGSNEGSSLQLQENPRTELSFPRLCSLNSCVPPPPSECWLVIRFQHQGAVGNALGLHSSPSPLARGFLFCLVLQLLCSKQQHAVQHSGHPGASLQALNTAVAFPLLTPKRGLVPCSRAEVGTHPCSKGGGQTGLSSKFGPIPLGL